MSSLGGVHLISGIAHWQFQLNIRKSHHGASIFHSKSGTLMQHHTGAAPRQGSNNHKLWWTSVSMKREHHHSPFTDFTLHPVFVMRYNESQFARLGFYQKGSIWKGQLHWGCSHFKFTFKTFISITIYTTKSNNSSQIDWVCEFQVFCNMMAMDCPIWNSYTPLWKVYYKPSTVGLWISLLSIARGVTGIFFWGDKVIFPDLFPGVKCFFPVENSHFGKSKTNFSGFEKWKSKKKKTKTKTKTKQKALLFL